MTATYEWTVVFQHERNSFAKKLKAVAANYAEAVTKAERELGGRGYDAGDFTVTTVARGKYVADRKG